MDPVDNLTTHGEAIPWGPPGAPGSPSGPPVPGEGVPPHDPTDAAGPDDPDANGGEDGSAEPSPAPPAAEFSRHELGLPQGTGVDAEHKSREPITISEAQIEGYTDLLAHFTQTTKAIRSSTDPEDARFFEEHEIFQHEIEIYRLISDKNGDPDRVKIREFLTGDAKSFLLAQQVLRNQAKFEQFAFALTASMASPTELTTLVDTVATPPVAAGLPPRRLRRAAADVTGAAAGGVAAGLTAASTIDNPALQILATISGAAGGVGVAERVRSVLRRRSAAHHPAAPAATADTARHEYQQLVEGLTMLKGNDEMRTYLRLRFQIDLNDFNIDTVDGTQTIVIAPDRRPETLDLRGKYIRLDQHVRLHRLFYEETLGYPPERVPEFDGASTLLPRLEPTTDPLYDTHGLEDTEYNRRFIREYWRPNENTAAGSQERIDDYLTAQLRFIGDLTEKRVEKVETEGDTATVIKGVENIRSNPSKAREIAKAHLVTAKKDLEQITADTTVFERAVEARKEPTHETVETDEERDILEEYGTVAAREIRLGELRNETRAGGGIDQLKIDEHEVYDEHLLDIRDDRRKALANLDGDYRGKTVQFSGGKVIYNPGEEKSRRLAQITKMHDDQETVERRRHEEHLAELERQKSEMLAEQKQLRDFKRKYDIRPADTETETLATSIESAVLELRNIGITDAMLRGRDIDAILGQINAAHRADTTKGWAEGGNNTPENRRLVLRAMVGLRADDKAEAEGPDTPLTDEHSRLGLKEVEDILKADVAEKAKAVENVEPEKQSQQLELMITPIQREEEILGSIYTGEVTPEDLFSESENPATSLYKKDRDALVPKDVHKDPTIVDEYTDGYFNIIKLAFGEYRKPGSDDLSKIREINEILPPSKLREIIVETFGLDDPAIPPIENLADAFDEMKTGGLTTPPNLRRLMQAISNRLLREAVREVS